MIVHNGWKTLGDVEHVHLDTLNYSDKLLQRSPKLNNIFGVVLAMIKCIKGPKALHEARVGGLQSWNVLLNYI